MEFQHLIAALVLSAMPAEHPSDLDGPKPRAQLDAFLRGRPTLAWVYTHWCPFHGGHVRLTSSCRAGEGCLGAHPSDPRPGWARS